MQKKEMQRRHSLQNLHLSVPEFTRNSQHLFSSLLSFVTFLIIFSHCYSLLYFYLNQHTGKQRANLALSRKSQFCLCKTSEVGNNNET